MMRNDDDAVTGTPIRVLLAEDEVAMRGLLRFMLARDGRFAVAGEAADGEEAVRLAGDVQPDAVLLDLNLPRLDGLAALPRIRRAAPACRVIVVSGAAEPRRVEALRLGAAEYIEKLEFSAAADAIINACLGPPNPNDERQVRHVVRQAGRRLGRAPMDIHQAEEIAVRAYRRNRLVEQAIGTALERFVVAGPAASSNSLPEPPAGVLSPT